MRRTLTIGTARPGRIRGRGRGSPDVTAALSKGID